MSASPEKSLRLTFVLLVGLIIAGIFIVPLLLGVWLPDVFIDRVYTLAQARLASGHSFQVIQYWNHGDFYNTELMHTAPDGSVERHVLDGDDGKSWSVPLTVDELQKTATVILSGHRVRKVEW